MSTGPLARACAGLAELDGASTTCSLRPCSTPSLRQASAAKLLIRAVAHRPIDAEADRRHGRSASRRFAPSSEGQGEGVAAPSSTSARPRGSSRGRPEWPGRWTTSTPVQLIALAAALGLGQRNTPLRRPVHCRRSRFRAAGSICRAPARPLASRWSWQRLGFMVASRVLCRQDSRLRFRVGSGAHLDSHSRRRGARGERLRRFAAGMDACRGDPRRDARLPAATSPRLAARVGDQHVARAGLELERRRSARISPVGTLFYLAFAYPVVCDRARRDRWFADGCCRIWRFIRAMVSPNPLARVARWFAARALRNRRRETQPMFDTIADRQPRRDRLSRRRAPRGAWGSTPSRVYLRRRCRRAARRRRVTKRIVSGRRRRARVTSRGDQRSSTSRWRPARRRSIPATGSVRKTQTFAEPSPPPASVSLGRRRPPSARWGQKSESKTHHGPRRRAARCPATTATTRTMRCSRARPDAIGCPVLIKATRRRRRQGHARSSNAREDFAAALASARREAKRGLRRRSRCCSRNI